MEHTYLLALLVLIGFASIVAYGIGERIIGWILDGGSRTCESCAGAGVVRDEAGLYWRCNTCEGRGERLVAA